MTDCNVWVDKCSRCYFERVDKNGDFWCCAPGRDMGDHSTETAPGRYKGALENCPLRPGAINVCFTGKPFEQTTKDDK